MELPEHHAQAPAILVEGGRPTFGSFAGAVGRAKAQVFLSRRWWTRLVVDASTLEDRRSGEAVLAWEGAPGRAFFLGGSVQEQASEREWSSFAKLSWAIRG